MPHEKLIKVAMQVGICYVPNGESSKEPTQEITRRKGELLNSKIEDGN